MPFRARARPIGANFVRGEKQIYLPNFTLTFIRTPNLSPRWAQFIVPLNFNKLDMRDYLFHAYNVSVRSVRSYIQFQPIQRRLPFDKGNLPGKRQKFRPKGIKKMTVELLRPFVWPDPPVDMEKWEQNRYDAVRKDQLEKHGEDILEKQREKLADGDRLRNGERLEVKKKEKYNPRKTEKPEGEAKLEKKRKDMRQKAEDILTGKVKWGHHPSMITDEGGQAEQVAR